jgi:hypothetical protein
MRVVLEPWLTLVLPEKDFLKSVIFLEPSMDPAMSASIVKVFPKPISYRMLANIFY